MITNEIKAKVFANYLGQTTSDKRELLGVTKCSHEMLKPDTYVAIFENEQEEFIEDIKLILRPLQSITDVEAIEMAKLFGEIDGKIILNRPSDLTNKDIHFSVQVYTNEPKFTSYSTPKQWRDAYGVNAYHWLQQKGFDLPHYLLGDKTLKEAELAIYE